MRPLKQRLAPLLGQAGRYQQHRRGSTEQGGVELGLVDDEVLVEDRQRDAALTSRADEAVVPSEVVLVSQDAQRCSTVLLVRQGYHVCLPFLLDPSLGRAATLELGNDAGVALQQGLAQRGLRGAQLFQLQMLVGNDLL